MLAALLDSTDFLTLTLKHPEPWDTNLSVTLGGHTQVSLWDRGIILFEPIEAGEKDIIFSCGVHGNETAPIELCNRIISQLLQQKIIAKHRILFIIGNPNAINNGTRIVDENMNRLFSGAHSIPPGLINPERIRAKRLEEYVERFFNTAGRERLHYDLHTAMRSSKHEKFAVYPYRPNRAYSGEQLMFLAASGVEAVLFHHEPTTTFSYFSSERYGAEAFTLELGKVYPLGQNDMSRLLAAEEMFSQLITAKSLTLGKFDPAKLHLYQVCRVINKHASDFEFTFAADVENFSAFPKGFVLAREGGQDILVEQECEAIVFPNAKVPIGQRTLICVVPAQEPNIS
ncbi:MAG: succinylglutamate desuccinylase [Shewanella sp.]